MKAEKSKIAVSWEQMSFILRSIFIAYVPAILVNLLSDLISKALEIDMGKSFQAVLMLIIITFLMFLQIPRLKTGTPLGVTYPGAIEGASRRIKMQSGMFFMAMLSTELCAGLLTGPITTQKLEFFLLSLIPIIEGAFGSQFIIQTNKKYYSFGIRAINDLLRVNTRVTENMILSYAQQLSPILPDHTELFIKMEMARYIADEKYRAVVNKNEIVILDSYRHPENWQLIRRLYT